MSAALGMAWRQYRLERRLFWRNPSAAFFNFLLPLLFLAFFGAIFHGNQHDLNVIVPGIAGMSVMSTTFSALAFNMTFLREQGVLKRIRGTPMPGSSYLLGIAGNAITNTAVQIAIITVAGRVFFGTGWPKDWPELILFVAVGVLCFASLGVALSHAIPNFDSAPAYVNAVFLPVIFISGVFYDATKAPGFLQGHRPGPPAQARHRRALGRDGHRSGHRAPRHGAGGDRGLVGAGRRPGHPRVQLGDQAHMTLAVIYDVHGNLPALEAVLTDAAGAGAERYLLGGDYALFGPWPAETVARLREIPDATWIRGNVDRWTAFPGQVPDPRDR